MNPAEQGTDIITRVLAQPGMNFDAIIARTDRRIPQARQFLGSGVEAVIPALASQETGTAFLQALTCELNRNDEPKVNTPDDFKSAMTLITLLLGTKNEAEIVKKLQDQGLTLSEQALAQLFTSK